jgi:glycosyltransferase involved in cell wall biosynthesis
MRVLHVPFSYLPDPPGGTELYVEALCAELVAEGIDCAIAAPGKRSESYKLGKLRVYRLGAQPAVGDLDELYGEGDPRSAERFDAILEAERPDVVHQHALSPACSVQLVERAKRRKLPVVFTYHTPRTSCQRGTLLEWGQTACDGRVTVERCTPCTLNGLGLGKTSSRLLASAPNVVGDGLARLRLSGSLWTALRLRHLMARRHESLRRFFSLVDVFVALTPWTRGLLTANGVPDRKIVLCPHGIPAAGPRRAMTGRRPGEPLRVVHLGRVDPTKGTHVLVEAVRGLPDTPISLDVLGVVQSETAASLLSRLESMAGDDSRIRFLGAVPHHEVLGRLSGYDVVAVPSQLFETGPLVVLEAFAAGVPVVGSALGGIAEKVTDGVDGLLVAPHHSVEAWRQALRRLAADRDLVAKLRNGTRAPRSAREVARAMTSVYQGLAAAPALAGPHVRA